jgi:hypothetical protein
MAPQRFQEGIKTVLGGVNKVKWELFSLPAVLSTLVLARAGRVFCSSSLGGGSFFGPESDSLNRAWIAHLAGGHPAMAGPLQHPVWFRLARVEIKILAI